MSRRKPVVAWAVFDSDGESWISPYEDEARDRLFDLREEGDRSAYAAPLVEADPDAERVVEAILAFRAGRLDRAKLEHAVERLEWRRAKR